MNAVWKYAVPIAVALAACGGSNNDPNNVAQNNGPNNGTPNRGLGDSIEGTFEGVLGDGAGVGVAVTGGSFNVRRTQ